MFGDVVQWVRGTDDLALLDELRAIEGRRREDAAREATVLAELDRRKTYRSDGHATMWGLLRTNVHWSDRECAERMRIARLVDEYPDVGETLYEHQISIANVAEIARVGANTRIADQFDAKVGEFVRFGEHHEYDDLRERVRSWEQQADAEHVAQVAHEAHEARVARVKIDRDEHSGELTARFGLLDAIEIREIFDQYVDAEWHTDWDAAVARYGDDASTLLMERTDAQRRADALKQIFVDAASRPVGSKAPEPVTVIHVDHHTFTDILVRAGLLPESVADPFDDPTPHITHLLCRTEHGDPLDPTTVLQTILEGYIRFAIHDEHGIPITWGRKRRLFQGAARDAVRSLSVRCTHPGCRVSTKRTQTDHTTDYADGGDTDPANGNPRCARHNRLKNRGYTVHRDAQGDWHTYRPDGSEIA